MVCEPARGLPGSGGGYRCELDGKAQDKPRVADDYLELDVPAAMLTADTARVEVRWSEAVTVAAR